MNPTQRRILALLLVAPLSACATKSAKKTGPTKTPLAQAERLFESDDSPASHRDHDAVASPQLETVTFAYDASELGAEARTILQSNASWLKSRPEVKAVVEGHCDERGTTAYNLALGERRAHAVRDYYASLGVPAARLTTISYGEERLLCRDAVEACHARNRRGVTAVLAPAAARHQRP